MVRTKLLKLCLEHVGIARERGVSAGAKVTVRIRKVAIRVLELLRWRGRFAVLRRRVAN